MPALNNIKVTGIKKACIELPQSSIFNNKTMPASIQFKTQIVSVRGSHE